MKTFRLDRRHGKFLGVCAGISNYTGLNANVIRICLVVLTLVIGTPIFFLGYFALAWAGGQWPNRWSRDGEVPRLHNSVRTMGSELSETDRRLAEIERYVASPNNQLASEIDSLR